jgi:hypothetical protein
MSVHEETLTATTTCKNCETTFEGKFCSNCAQKTNTHRFTIPHFAHEVFHAFTHTDKGILFLIKKLFRWPGIVAREYVEGKRKKYFSPITFLLITMAIQIYVVKKTDFYGKFVDETKKLVQSISSTSPSKTGTDASLQALDEAKGMTAKAMENSKMITFIFLPVLASLTWIFFWKSGLNYIENLILAIFVQGQLHVLFFIMCILPILIIPSSIVVIFYAYVVVTWAYSLIAYRQFFRQRKWVTVLKGSVVQIIYFALGQQITNIMVGYL